MKRCPQCKTEKPDSAFSTRTVNGVTYPASWCNPCKVSATVAWQHARCVATGGPVGYGPGERAAWTDQELADLREGVEAGLTDMEIWELSLSHRTVEGIKKRRIRLGLVSA